MSEHREEEEQEFELFVPEQSAEIAPTQTTTRLVETKDDGGAPGLKKLSHPFGGDFLNTCLKQLRAQICSLTEDNEAQKKELEDISGQKDHLESSVLSLKLEKKHLEEVVRQRDEEILQLKEEISTSHADPPPVDPHFEEEVERLKGEQIELTHIHAEACNKLSEREDQIEALTTQIEIQKRLWERKIVERTKSLEDSLNDLIRENERYRSDKQLLEAERNSLKKDRDDLQVEARRGGTELQHEKNRREMESAQHVQEIGLLAVREQQAIEHAAQSLRRVRELERELSLAQSGQGGDHRLRLEEDNAQGGEPSPRPRPVPGPWTCGSCTFENPPTVTECTICDSPKPVLVAPPRRRQEAIRQPVSAPPRQQQQPQPAVLGLHGVAQMLRDLQQGEFDDDDEEEAHPIPEPVVADQTDEDSREEQEEEREELALSSSEEEVDDW